MHEKMTRRTSAELVAVIHQHVAIIHQHVAVIHQHVAVIHQHAQCVLVPGILTNTSQLSSGICIILNVMYVYIYVRQFVQYTYSKLK